MWQQWKNGLPESPDYFPIGVWLQSPDNARRYADAGFNLYVGLWEGPTEKQLAALTAAKMQVICEQNAVGLAHKNDPIIVGWLHGDEPDNAQEVIDKASGKKSYGPFIAPEKVVETYHKICTLDPTRPVLLNLGQGVANDAWIGRGPGAKLSDYKTYVLGGDIISFDVYPVSSGLPLNLVPKGIDRLKEWTSGKKRVWNFLECSRIEGKGKATIKQVRYQTWRSLIHGSRGLIYFVHQFQPRFTEHALLDDSEMLAAVTATHKQIREIAPLLNQGKGVFRDSGGIETLTLTSPAGTYILAASTTNGMAKLTLPAPPRGGTVSVLGENRTLQRSGAVFTDTFGPEDAHLYRIVVGPE